MKLAGKVALVTGAARGQGRNHCLRLAQEGADIVALDICHDLPYPGYHLSTPEQLDDVVREVRALDRRALGLQADVRSLAEVSSAVERAIAEFGKIDILVNNAGIAAIASVTDMTEEQWDLVLDVDLKGVWVCCKYVVPHMMAQRYGKIINIASVAGLKGLGWGSHYSAAKHGVIGLTKSLAIETVQDGITVNAICPGTIFTPMIGELANVLGMDYDTAKSEMASGHMIELPIEWDDVSNMVIFLASDESRMLTGCVLTVDAGWLLR